MIKDVAMKRYCKNCNAGFYVDEVIDTDRSTKFTKYCSKKCAKQHKLAKKLNR